MGELLRMPGLAAVMVASVITVTAADLIVIYLPLLGAARSIDVNVIGGLLTAVAFAALVIPPIAALYGTASMTGFCISIATTIMITSVVALN